MREVLALILGYLLGSIPTAYLIARWQSGQDIRSRGVNIGGLTIFRQFSARAGVMTIFIDLAKGALPVIVAFYLLKPGLAFVLLAGLAAIAGHNWMVWLRFKGGHGVATAFGALIPSMILYGYIAPLSIELAIVIVLLVITRNVALSSGVAFLLLPFIIWWASKSELATILAILLFLLVPGRFVLSNWKRLKDPETRRNLIIDHWRRPDGKGIGKA